MSPYLDDDFSKAYTTTLYQTKGQIDLNVKVKSRDWDRSHQGITRNE